ncbi:MAG: ABC transporter ATP-binding protein [Clostridiales bacterium]|jgi:ATP-binding cassette subfamily B protein|nr:ABC transporter ATP-binding protein [Clostridiales bacterium]
MIKRFINYYRPHWLLLAVDLVSVLVFSVLSLALPIIISVLIDDIIPAKDLQGIKNLSLLLVIMFLFKALFRFGQAYYGHLLAHRIERDMRRDFFYHLQKLSFGFFDDRKTGDIMSRVTNDISKVNEMTNHAPEDIFSSFLMIAGSFIFLFAINVKLTLITFLPVPLLFWFSFKYGARMFRGFRRVNRAMAEINHRLENTIAGIRVVQSFTMEDYEKDRFDRDNEHYYEASAGVMKHLGIFLSTTIFIEDMALLLVIASGGYFVYCGRISVGELVAFMFYVKIFVEPIIRLARLNEQIQRALAGLERFYEFLDVRPDIKDSPGAVSPGRVRGDVEFRNVTFSYNEDEEVLKDFDLKVAAGDIIALVGPSGVGKSTLCSLIPRFYDVKEGAILVDGRDIRKLKLRELRENIGIVQQDVFLFTGTVRENIAYGRPDASEEEIIEAAKSANAHRFIMQLPDGYDTGVGEKGVKLSGGQKQRISIARVFLKNPPILILDEATSSLDNESERIIQESLERLAKNRTTFVIAHRLSTIQHAREIIVMSERGIEEKGNHQELLLHGGLYARLYNAQFDGRLPEAVK